MTPGYLLILDNADDLALAREVLPVKQSGHVLLTTRAQVTGRFARRLEVDELPTRAGHALFVTACGSTGFLMPRLNKRKSQIVSWRNACVRNWVDYH